MKKLSFILLLFPLLSTAQKTLPRFENDTLYTLSGYTIYKGQILHLATGTSAAGYFRFIKFHFSQNKTNTYTLQNSNILVKQLKGYKYSGPENNNIRIAGTVTYPGGKKEETDITMNFERAITGSDGLPGELTVPDEFKNNRAETVTAETKKTRVPDEFNSDKGEIMKVIKLYLRVTDNKDSSAMVKAFHPDAKLMSVTKSGVLKQMTQAEWWARVSRIADAPVRKNKITILDLSGIAAVVKVEFETSCDYICLLKINNDWKIINKTLSVIL